MKTKQTLPFVLAALFATPAVWAESALFPSATDTPAAQEEGLVAGPFKLTGTIRARADGGDTDSSYAGQANQPSATHSHLNFDVFPSVRLYKDWRVVSEFESQLNLHDKNKDFFDNNNHMHRFASFNKLWLEGTVYDKVKVRAGRFGAFSSYGRVLDNTVVGGEANFNYKYPVKVTAAHMTSTFNDNAWGVKAHRDPLYAIQSTIPLGDNAHIGATYAYAHGFDNNGKKDNASFIEIGADVKPVPDVSLMAAFSHSTINDVKDSAGNKVKQNGWFTQAQYKNADLKTPNSYDVYLNYRNVGAMSGISSTNDYSKNVKGFQIGGDYVLLKNLKLGAFYLAGKQVNPTVGTEKQDVNVWRTQLEYSF